MKQILLDLNSGILFLEEVPVPKPSRGVVVQNHYSAISAGTESSLIALAQKSKLAMAQERPDLVKKVIDKAKTDGILSAYHQAMSRLSKPEPLGYSCAGVVTDSDITEFSVGDRVACGGAGYASHAEYVSVPKNLCVKIPDNVSFRDASFTTIGAIAMQGIRNAEVTVGEKIAVIGLGLIGLLTIQIAKAAGCKVYGIDVDPKKIELARELGADSTSNYENLQEKFLAFSSFGADKVIITAATASNGPVETAGDLVRTGGKVIAVGAVGMNLPREKYYNKEAEFVVSRSYGPGRYDRNFEERGIDYPIYVRWTEKRNMEAFLDLLSDNKIKLEKIITHVFDINNAVEAYDLINTRKEPFLGVVLSYDTTKIEQISGLDLHTVHLEKGSGTVQKTSKSKPLKTIGCIGAGIHATSTLYPYLVRLPVRLKGIATATGLSAAAAGKKFGFEYCTTDYQKILNDPDIEGVIIATRNDLHAKITVEALAAGKEVFVEKPLATTMDELLAVKAAYEKYGGRIMVGFNRRYSPYAKRMKKFFMNRTTPLMMHYRVNSGTIPADHWVHDNEQGGGMLISEVCHFIDFLQYMVSSRPLSVYAEAPKSEASNLNRLDNIQITISFEDGSIGTVSYSTSGNSGYSKELIELFGNASAGSIRDFREINLVNSKEKYHKKSYFTQDKGIFNELHEFVNNSPMDVQEMLGTHLILLHARTSLETDKKIFLESM